MRPRTAKQALLSTVKFQLEPEDTQSMAWVNKLSRTGQTCDRRFESFNLTQCIKMIPIDTTVSGGCRFSAIRIGARSNKRSHKNCQTAAAHCRLSLEAIQQRKGNQLQKNSATVSKELNSPLDELTQSYLIRPIRTTNAPLSAHLSLIKVDPLDSEFFAISQ